MDLHLPAFIPNGEFLLAAPIRLLILGSGSPED